jgi:hypothetical protein
VVERDTSPEAHRVQLEVLRRLGESGRGALAIGMSDDMRQLLIERIAREQPHLDERGRVRALVAFLYGEPLAAKAFGHDRTEATPANSE